MQDTLNRKPAGKGRFDPSEPLHMTTRHAAARNVRPGGSSSINGSVDDNDSRRGSMDDFMHNPAHDFSPPKGRRISGESHHSTSQLDPPFGHISIPQFGLQGSQSPSRKRKRTYSTPHISESIDTDTHPATRVRTTEENLDTFNAVVVPGDHLSDRVSAGSSSSRDPEHYAVAIQSNEVTPTATPMASEPVSPVSDETNITPHYSVKHMDIAMADIDGPGDEEDLDDIDDDDVPVAAEDIDDVADPEDDEDQVTAGPRKRLTGRRRADHHNVKIEATMRRQLQLKSAYRCIARALKPLLAEIAFKTVEELEANPVRHQQALEYESEGGVHQLLDAALANRKRQLELQVKHNREQLRDRFLGEKAVRTNVCTNEVNITRQTRLDELEHEFLRIARGMQIEQTRKQDVTDDEDGDVLHRPKHTDYRFTRGAPLDPRHESRSRVGLETERAIFDMQRRFEMHEMLQDASTKESVQNMESFTVMDTTARAAAVAQRESICNIDMLMHAAAEVDRLANLPIIPNEEAVGLQVLGDLASRPSVRAAVLSPATPRRLDEAFVPEQREVQLPTSERTPGGLDKCYQSPLRFSPGTEQFVPHQPQNSTQRSHSERPTWDTSLASSPPTSTKRLSDFPFLRSYFGSPSLNLPGKHEPPQQQHRRQLSHDTFQHHRQPSQGLILCQRNDSEESVQADSGSVEATLSDAWSRDDAARGLHRRPWTGDSRVRSSDPGESLSRFQPRILRPQEEPAALAAPTNRALLELDDANRETPEHKLIPQAERQIGVDEGDESRHRSHTRPVETVFRDDLLEQASSEGATEAQARDDEADHTRPTQEANEDMQTHKARSRGSSPDRSPTTDVSGSQDGDRGSHGRGKEGKHYLKPSKAQRNGFSRKALKELRKGSQKRPSPSVAQVSEGGSQMFRFRLNTADTSKSGGFTSRVPTGTPQSVHHGPDLPYPALPSYNKPPAAPAPFPPSHGPHGPSHGHHPPHYYHPDSYYPHRNSLPGPGAPPSWPPPPFGSSYGRLPPPPPPPPHGSSSMGPPPSEGWASGAAGSSASHMGGPHPGLSRTSSLSLQYGGPAIAPARPDARYPYGTGPPGGNHPPAFAQQQRNLEGGGSGSSSGSGSGSGGRRRTHSDAPRDTKWQHYNPSGKK